MGKNQSASNLTNIIQYNNGNISFVSGSTTLMQISASGAITTTGVISGSNALSASYAASASNALFAQTASYWSGSITNALSASYAASASNALFAQTASYWSGSINNALSASYAASASNALAAASASYVLNAVSASYAASASNALAAATASYILNAVSASYAASASNALSASNAVTAQTASYANTFTVGSTLTAQTLVVQTITSSVDYITGSSINGSLLTDTHKITGSLLVTGSSHSIYGKVAINTGSAFSEVTGLDAVGYNAFRENPASAHSWFPYTNGSAYVSCRTGSSIYFREYHDSSTTIFMTITGSKVGIGTTSPSYTLDVAGQVKINSTYPQLILSGSDVLLTMYDTFQPYAYSMGVGYNKNYAFEIIDRGTSGTSNSTVFIITGSNVGINTTSPGYQLEVSPGVSNATIKVGSWAVMQNVTTNQAMFGYNTLYQTSAGSSWRYLNTGYAMAIRMHDAFGSGDMMFHLAASSSSLAPLTTAWDTTDIKMIIKNSGNVGIGITTPSSRLGVKAAGADGLILEQDANDATNSTRLFFTGSVQTFGILNNAGDLRFTYASQPGNTSGTSLARFTNTGKYFRMESGTGGIQFQGTTGAANALNYYEEGSWTPGFGNAGSPSYSTQFGKYTRIGNIVYCTIALRATSVSSASTITLTGLPFTPADASDTGQRSTYRPSLGGHINGASDATGRFRVTGNTYMDGVKGDTTTTYMTATEFTSTGNVQITGNFLYYI